MYDVLWKPLGLILLLTVSLDFFGQCDNFTSNYPAGTFVTNNTNWRRIDDCVYGGDFQNFSVVTGATYEWTSCYGNGFDTEITLWDASHSTVIAHEENNCGTIHGSIVWTATFTGNVHLLLSQQGCVTNTACHRMWWRMISAAPPPSNNTICSASPLDVGAICEMESVSLTGATGSGVPAPPCGSYQGADIWYSVIAPASGNVKVATQAGQVNDAAMAAYSGSCDNPTLIACNDDAVGYMPELELTGITPGQTVYIRLYAYGAAQSGEFDLCVYEPCSGTASNDLMCTPETLTFGSPTLGDNSCAGSVNDPATPGCWTGGTVNSLWYSFIAPAGGEVRIDTEPISIAATQIALYSGTCFASILEACNQDAGEGCGPIGSSSLSYNGLIPGAEYFIMVDGEENTVGQFYLTISNTGLLSAASGSDCASPIPICSPTFSVADPGPQGTGNFCDFDGQGNCTGGERNSVWYQIDIEADGQFQFTITPSDGSVSSCGTETDYDFVLWRMSGAGQVTSCDLMSADASQGLLACNYDERGVTGISIDGNAPAGFNACFDNSFEPAVNVTEGDVLYLVVQNYSGSVAGFNIDFTDSGQDVVPGSVPDVLYWTGGNGTAWNDPGNWGNCGYVPSCDIPAVIPSNAANHPVLTHQPVVSDNAQSDFQYSVGGVIIESGATLELGQGAHMEVCGDFINNGTLQFDRTSTLHLNLDSDQDLGGALTGDNALGNLTIDKEEGQVNLISDLELKGDFLTTSIDALFNTNGMAVYLGGNFRNSNGWNTFRGVGATGRLVFNGTAEQTYSQGESNLGLNQVEIQNTGGGVTLLSEMRIRNNTGSLTLTNGVIRTGEHEVQVRNPSPSALNSGNPDSYIEGTLRRYIEPTGLYHLPVGHSATGYQLADVDFRSNLITYLTVTHSPWAPNPGPLMDSECMTVYDLPALDNGFFTITANTDPLSADYDITLFNMNYSNHGSATGWTVMKDSGSGWGLDGDCEVSSAHEVRRTGLTGFSRFATAQASNPLPIELLTFNGASQTEGNEVYWITASEVNNDYFTLESSSNARDFVAIAEVPGAGFSSIELYYEHLDRNAADGVTYYRLKQTDYDGTFSYSDIIAIERNASYLEDALWPNPAKEFIQVRLPSTGFGVGEVFVTDILGKTIASTIIWSELRDDLLLVQGVDRLRQGVYVLHVMDQRGMPIMQERFTKE